MTSSSRPRSTGSHSAPACWPPPQHDLSGKGRLVLAMLRWSAPDQRSMLVFPARSSKLVEAWLSVDYQYALDGFFSVATQPSVGA